MARSISKLIFWKSALLAITGAVITAFFVWSFILSMQDESGTIYLSKWMLAALFGGASCLVLGLTWIISPESHPGIRAVSRYGQLKTDLAQIDSELDGARELPANFRVTQHWLIHTRWTSLEIMRLSAIVLAYRKPNLEICILVICDSFGTKYEWKIDGFELTVILAEIAKLVPTAQFTGDVLTQSQWEINPSAPIIPTPIPPIIATEQVLPLPWYWTCPPPGRFIAKLALLAGLGSLLVPLLVDFVAGSFVILTTLLLLTFLWQLVGILEGGCSLRKKHSELIRWRGIGIPFWWRRIPYATIQEVVVGRGKRPGNRNDTWSHVAITTPRGSYLIKRFDYLPETRRFATRLASELGRASVKEII